jgi:hypothetical protein
MSGATHPSTDSGKVVPHIAVVAGKVIPHAAAGKVLSYAAPAAAEETAASDAIGPLVDHLNGILEAGGLGRPLGPVEEVLAVLPLPVDVDKAAVVAALRQAAENREDVPAVFPWPN